MVSRRHYIFQNGRRAWLRIPEHLGVLGPHVCWKRLANTSSVGIHRVPDSSLTRQRLGNVSIHKFRLSSLRARQMQWANKLEILESPSVWRCHCAVFESLDVICELEPPWGVKTTNGAQGLVGIQLVHLQSHRSILKASQSESNNEMHIIQSPPRRHPRDI